MGLVGRDIDESRRAGPMELDGRDPDNITVFFVTGALSRGPLEGKMWYWWGVVLVRVVDWGS